MNLPAQIKQWRLDARLTMEEAAARAGVAQPTWQGWEKKNAQRRPETCLKIAKGIGQAPEIVLAAAGYDVTKNESPLAKEVAVQELLIDEKHRERFRAAAMQALKAVASAYQTA